MFNDGCYIWFRNLIKKQTLPYVGQNNNVRIVVKSFLYYLMITEKSTCQIEYTVKIYKNI